MKAIRAHEFGPPEVMVYEEIPDPVAGAGEVVVRTHAVGVNPVETYIRSGIYHQGPELPFTPGADAAGVVDSVGDKVDGFAVGDRVYTAGTISGAYAEQVLCRANEVHAIPENVDFDQGAAVNVPYATAYRGLHQRGGGRPGETLLVHGASGAVGTAAVQLATAHGMRVIGTAGTDKGIELVKAQGADQVLNHTQSDYFDRLLDLTNGSGVDLILEMLSNINLARDLTALAMGGRIVVIGCRGAIEINPREAMMREADIRGMALFNASSLEISSIHRALGAGLANSTLRPVVGRRFPLAEAPGAHVAVLEPGAYGKIVLIP